MSFNGAEGMAFEQFFLKRLNTTRATRDMLEATLLELHQGGEIVVVDESGAPPGCRQSEEQLCFSPVVAALFLVFLAASGQRE